MLVSSSLHDLELSCRRSLTPIVVAQSGTVGTAGERASMPMQRLLLTQQLLQLFVCGARGMNTIAHPPSQLIPRSIGHSASSQEMPSTSDHVLRQAAQQVLHAARQHTSDMRGAADTIAAKQDERTTTALSQAASPLLSRDLEPQSAKSHCTEPLSGEYLVKTPSVFRGVSSDGKLTDPLPILPKEETLQLIQSAWFYLSSSDARRELNERNGGSAALDADAIFDPSHEAIIACMRTRSAAAVSALRKSTGKLSAKQQSDVAARAVATTCQLLFPDNMSDTEFRLRESVGRSAYNKLFLHHQRLIYAEVTKVLPNWATATVMEKADFLQEGAQGLLRAIRLFDLAKGVQFSTYAVWHIRAYVLRAIRDKGRLVRLPQVLQQDMAQIRKARYRYAVENQGCTPDAQQLASMLQWSSERVDSALSGLASSEPCSLDQTYDDGDQPILMSQMASAHGCAATESALYHQQLSDTVRHAQSQRDPSRARIVRLKYGLEDGKEWTYPELAERFQMTVNVAKGIVRAEIDFLRRNKRSVLEQFSRAE